MLGGLRPGRILLLAAACLGVVAAGVPRARAALRGMETFRVGELQLSGGRYLTLEEAVLAASVPRDASVWDDPAPWEERLAAHPLVRTARVRRRLPATLVLVVEEREPVGLTPTPTLEPVDADGRILPLDPAAHAFDLPLLDAGGREDEEEAAALAALAGEAARLGRVDPAFVARLSELTADERGDLVARWDDTQVTFRFRPAVPARRLREGLLALSDQDARRGARRPATVDLRFADQVVVRVP